MGRRAVVVSGHAAAPPNASPKTLNLNQRLRSLAARAQDPSVAYAAVAVRLQQSLTDFERAFEDQIRAERQAALRVHEKVAHRATQRQIDTVNRRGTLRFLGLVATLLATATIVTLVMFRVLYLVLGG